ncbi:MAG: stage III sporulation protein AF [Bacillota bacterium]
MLEILSDIVRNIAFIVLLAAFVEMLLPGEQIGRYVRLIMGLFVVVTLLTPILDNLDKGLAYGVTAWNIPSNRGLTTILQRGEELKQRQEEIALREYVNRLERQIQAVVQLVSGVDRAVVSVELERGQSRQLGEIKKVTIAVWVKSSPREKFEEEQENEKAGNQVAPRRELVAPIQVYLGTETVQGVSHGQTLSENILQNVKTTVCHFYDLPPSKVVVTTGM